MISFQKEYMYHVNLLFRCVVKDFEKRPFISELFDHPFISQVPQDTTKVCLFFFLLHSFNFYGYFFKCSGEKK